MDDTLLFDELVRALDADDGSADGLPDRFFVCASKTAVICTSGVRTSDRGLPTGVPPLPGPLGPLVLDQLLPVVHPEVGQLGRLRALEPQEGLQGRSGVMPCSGLGVFRGGAATGRRSPPGGQRRSCGQVREGVWCAPVGLPRGGM